MPLIQIVHTSQTKSDRLTAPSAFGNEQPNKEIYMEYIIIENGIIVKHVCAQTKPENAIEVPSGFGGYQGMKFAALKDDLSGPKPLPQQVSEGIINLPDGYKINEAGNEIIRMEQAEIDQKYPPKNYAVEGAFEAIEVRKTFDRDGEFGYWVADGMIEMIGEQPGKAYKAVNGQWVFDLPTGQAIKLNAVKTAFAEASADAHCTSSAGFVIDANETANRDINGLVNVLKATGTENTLFRAYDNSFHSVTIEQLETMLTEISLNGQYLYQAKWAIEAQIQDAETAEALEAITVTAESLTELANALMSAMPETTGDNTNAETV